MATTEERVDRLETTMAELADAQLRTQLALKAFSETTEALLKRLSEAEARQTEAQAQTDARIAEARERQSQARTDAALNRLSAEMREFKDEMREFRAEERESRKNMNRRWGELANQLALQCHVPIEIVPERDAQFQKPDCHSEIL